MHVSNHIGSKTVFVLLSIVIVITAVYANISSHQFLYWDDVFYVLDNKQLHSLSLNNILGIFSNFDSLNWHPVTSLSLAANFALWGKGSISFIVTNIVLHIINTILLFFLCLKIFRLCQQNYQIFGNQMLADSETRVYLASIITSAIFAIHPLHVESVVWIVERKDVLSALFYFAATLAYIKQTESEQKTFWVNTTALLFLFSLMSKSMAVSLPVVLMLIDIFITRRVSLNLPYREMLKKLLGNKIVLLSASMVFAIVASFTQKGEIQDFDSLGLTSRVINAAMSILHYLYSFINPSSLSPYYPYKALSTTPSFTSLIPLLAVLLVCYILYRLYKKGRVLPAVAFIIFVMTLLPVLGLVKVGHAAAADRYTYIPMVSITMLFSYTVVRLIYLTKNIINIRIAATIFVSYLVFLAAITKEYIGYWENDRVLWERVIEIYPQDSFVPYINLGNTYYRTGKYEAALELYNTAYRINSTDISVLQHIGRLYEAKNDFENASLFYNKIVKENPESAEANIITGDFYYTRKDFARADHYFKKALSLSPAYAPAIYKNAIMDYARQDKARSLEKINYVLALNPRHVGALELLAQIKYNDGLVDESIRLANSILEIDSDNQFSTDLLKYTAATGKNTALRQEIDNGK